jgi:hypothetical protein
MQQRLGPRGKQVEGVGRGRLVSGTYKPHGRWQTVARTKLLEGAFESSDAARFVHKADICSPENVGLELCSMEREEGESGRRREAPKPMSNRREVQGAVVH